MTGTSRRPFGCSAWASEHSAFGTRKTVAPSRAAAWVLRETPPTAPTVPSASIVPVPATVLPPVRSPSSSLSTMPREKSSPALGPPMSARCRVTFTSSGSSLR
ncbi:hypothetical protein BN2537_10763 [Streptomyces venezuelae]|nr:hypothetical protein BN2537_10763 [Streptomyces venezuelae]